MKPLTVTGIHPAFPARNPGGPSQRFGEAEGAMDVDWGDELDGDEADLYDAATQAKAEQSDC